MAVKLSGRSGRFIILQLVFELFLVRVSSLLGLQA